MQLMTWEQIARMLDGEKCDSRIIDAQIALTLAQPAITYALIEDNGNFEFGRTDSIGVITWRRRTYAPPYTDSVEAAMSLIPEGLYLDLHDWTWAEGPCWCASLQSTNGERVKVSAKGPSAAIAICRAAVGVRVKSPEPASA